MEFAGLPIDIIARLWDPIARRVNYPCKIGRNMGNLRNQVNELTCSKIDLQIEVDRAMQEGKVATNEVLGWFESAKAIIESANAIIRDARRIRLEQ